MNLSLEEKQALLASMGRNPKRDVLTQRPDGNYEVVPGAITEPTIIGTAGRALGKAIPRALVSSAGASAAGMIAAPTVIPAIPTTGPLAVGIPLAAGLAGGALAGAAYDPIANLFKSQQKQDVETAQEAADREAHPIAATLGHLGGSMVPFRLSFSAGKESLDAVKALYNGGLKNLTPANVSALANAGVNTISGAVPKAVDMMTSDRPVTTSDVVDLVGSTALGVASKPTFVSKGVNKVANTLVGAPIAAAVRGTLNPVDPTDASNIILPSTGVPGQTAKKFPALREPLANFAAGERTLRGIGATAIDEMSRHDPAVLESAAKKANDAYESGVNAPFDHTPEEAAAWKPFADAMGKFRLMNNYIRKKSDTINSSYFPQMPKPEFLHEITKDPTSLNKGLLDFLAYNNAVGDPDAIEYYNRYMTSAATGQHVGEFNPLVKNARTYYLPPSQRESNPIEVMNRYNIRAARDLARTKFLENDPNVKQYFGKDVPLDKDLRDVHDYVYGSMANEKNGGQEAWQLVATAQGAVNRGLVQTPSSINNYIQGFAGPLRHVEEPGDLVNILSSQLAPIMRYKELRDKAIEIGAYTPKAQMQSLKDDMEFTGSLAQRLKNFVESAQSIPVVKQAQSIGPWFEQFARMRDTAIGQSLAEKYATRLNQDPNDKSAQSFFTKFSPGYMDVGRSKKGKLANPLSLVDTATANFVADLQGAYSPEDLPAAMVRPGLVNVTARLSRYGVSNAGRVYDNLLGNLNKGNYGATAAYIAGSLGVGMLSKSFMETLRGTMSSHPQNKDVDAMPNMDPDEARAHKLANFLEIGDAGSTIGILSHGAAVAANLNRGETQPVVQDTLSAATTTLANTALRFKDAIKKGIPASDALISAFGEAVHSTLQDSRLYTQIYDTVTGGHEAQKRQDKRDKAVYSKLAGITEPTAVDLGMGLINGNSKPKPTLGLERLQDQATEGGDPKALQALLGTGTAQNASQTITKAITYPGMYSPLGNDALNGLHFQNHLKFIENRDGPAAAEALKARMIESVQKRAAGLKTAASGLDKSAIPFKPIK